MSPVHACAHCSYKTTARSELATHMEKRHCLTSSTEGRGGPHVQFVAAPSKPETPEDQQAAALTRIATILSDIRQGVDVATALLFGIAVLLVIILARR